MKMNCLITNIFLICLSYLNLPSVWWNLAWPCTDFLTEYKLLNSFQSTYTKFHLLKLLFLPFMTSSSVPIANNKFLASVFLISLLHLIPSIILFFLNASHHGLASQVLFWLGSNLTLLLGLSMFRLEILNLRFISFYMVSPKVLFLVLSCLFCTPLL